MRALSSAFRGTGGEDARRGRRRRPRRDRSAQKLQRLRKRAHGDDLDALRARFVSVVPGDEHAAEAGALGGARGSYGIIDLTPAGIVTNIIFLF